MATPIIPPLPINEPGSPGSIAAPTTSAGTVLAEFVPTFVYPPEVPPNADTSTGALSGVVGQVLAPGLVAVAPGLSNVTVLPPV